jgi:hypothetical protein
MSNKSLFYDFVDINEINIIKAWLDSLPVKAKARITTRLNTLEQITRTDWHHTLLTEVLKGDKDGLIAVKVKYKRVQYRLLGYDGPNRGEFTLLAGGEERNDKYLPLNIGPKSFERIRDIEKNPDARRIRHDFG